MKRTTVLFDEETYARLQEIARRKGTTASLLIREAVGTYVAESGELERSPMEALIGLFDGPEGDWASRTDELVAEAIAEKFKRREAERDRR